MANGGAVEGIIPPEPLGESPLFPISLRKLIEKTKPVERMLTGSRDQLHHWEVHRKGPDGFWRLP